MAAAARKSARRNGPVSPGALIGVGAVIALLSAMVLDTHVVRIGSEQDTRTAAFSPESFGQEQFPRIQSLIESRAVEATELAPAALEDKAAAAEKYGTPGGIAPIFPVKFTGTVGEGRSGTFNIAVDELPDEVSIRVQTGPAVNGTELRDFPGDIGFGDFTNQIEYQNAGSGINNAMKAEVLNDLDRESLAGRTISVVGVFRMINPKNWLVTPVRLSVQ
ncbi:DUF2291 family protein [Notoacmeibacter sp. MSK16QG-6]|uniref:DUF2291 family protein n=1 Tax=Notoacmeibacter sp. MSK16QG-6 TaxID=2957982 RepID=UPI00209FCE56|nr:DUF2291 domain-containing protein [Notoacmeibacter sp. MSK16QG-6]MCP1200471.1 DUF2291 domain-containing protein [Notoacmeibacter sp. MSK16QG-6]